MPDATAVMSRPSVEAAPQSNGKAPSSVDRLDGYSEIDLPSVRRLRIFWDVDILDPEGETCDRIIEANEAFSVHIRMVLRGRLWSCIGADWWFDLGFSPVGRGTGFDLSEHLPADQLWVKNWRGCDHGRYIDLKIQVPANTIPTERCGTVYECAGKFEMYCCNKPAGVTGFEPLGSFEFYSPEVVR